MTKTYKLLIDSPEYPKGTEARWNEYQKSYEIYSSTCKNIYTYEGHAIFLTSERVENNSCWELVEDKLDLRSPEAEKMREEARSKRWDFVPSDGYPYWSYDIASKRAYDTEGSHLTGYYMYWNIGNCHRTKEDALAWGEKYARYFITE